MSRHLPDGGLTRAPPGRGHHCWAPVPLHCHSWMRVPLAMPLPATSMHLPRARMVPSLASVQVCAAVPLQVQSWMGVPSAVPLLRTSTHLPARPVIRPVRGTAGPPRDCPLRVRPTTYLFVAEAAGAVIVMVLPLLRLIVIDGNSGLASTSSA